MGGGTREQCGSKKRCTGSPFYALKNLTTGLIWLVTRVGGSSVGATKMHWFSWATSPRLPPHASPHPPTLVTSQIRPVVRFLREPQNKTQCTFCCSHTALWCPPHLPPCSPFMGHLLTPPPIRVHWSPLQTYQRGWGDGGRRGEVAHGGRARGGDGGGGTREQCGSNKKHWFVF